MKITKIDIDNFGTLSNYSISFKDGIKYLKENNGYGKTTLGAFIKVMFYGFDKESSKISDRERTKYKPWQGSEYGGSIEFEIKGKEYVLTRSFKDKAKDDISTLRDKKTKKETKELNIDDLGKQIFGIDAGSFERTVFLSQNDYDEGSLNDVDVKIGNMVNNTDDINNFDTAKKTLEEKIKELKNSRNNKGTIVENQEKINQYKQEMWALPTIENNIENTIFDIEATKDNIKKEQEKKNEIDEKIKEIGIKKDLAAKKKEYCILKENFSEIMDKKKKIIEYFNNEIPDKKIINECENKINEYYKEKESYKENTLSIEEISDKKKLNEEFGSKEYNESEFVKAQQLISENSNLANKIIELSLNNEEEELLIAEKEVFKNGFDITINDEYIKEWNIDRLEKKNSIDSLALSYSEQQELNDLELLFKDNPLNEEEADNLINKLSNNNYDITIERLTNSKSEIEKSKTIKISVVGLIISVILLAAGIVLFIYKDNLRTASIICMCFAILPILLFTVLKTTKEKKEKERKILEINNKLEDIKSEKDDLNNKAKAFMENYNNSSLDTNAVFNISNIKEKNNRYNKLLNNKNELEARKENCLKEIEEIEKKTKEYLKKFSIVQDDDNKVLIDLHGLSTRYERYCNLLNRKKSLDLQNAINKHKDNKLVIEEFFNKYGVTQKDEKLYFDTISSLKESMLNKKKLDDKYEKYKKACDNLDNLRREITHIFVKYGKSVENDWKIAINELQEQAALYDDNEKTLKNAKQSIENFRNDNPNYESIEAFVMDNDTASLEELTQNSKECGNSIINLNNELKKYEDNLDQYNEKIDDLRFKKGEIESLTNKNAELNKKYDLLSKAKDYLIEAKEAINVKYARPVEDSLKDYFKELANDTGIKIDIDVNKKLIISSKGAERDIRCLSKGYTDIVELCYRMALIDAMYTEEKPMIILDDPFINLDNERVEKGLKFLKKIGKRYQVLYLTCHDSRIPNSKNENN